MLAQGASESVHLQRLATAPAALRSGQCCSQRVRAAPPESHASHRALLDSSLVAYHCCFCPRSGRRTGASATQFAVECAVLRCSDFMAHVCGQGAPRHAALRQSRRRQPDSDVCAATTALDDAVLVARRASSAAAAATAPDHTVETTPTPGTATTTYNIIFITSEARPPLADPRTGRTPVVP